MSETKRCARCGETKPRAEFRQTWCRPCHREYERAYYAANRGRTREKRQEWGAQYRDANRERLRERARSWYANNRESVAEKTRAKKYGVSVEELRAILAPGKCEVCKSGENLHIDHDHKTGAVRGLLCASCNVGIGHFGDDEERLAGAIRYLRKRRQTRAAA